MREKSKGKIGEESHTATVPPMLTPQAKVETANAICNVCDAAQVKAHSLLFAFRIWVLNRPNEFEVC